MLDWEKKRLLNKIHKKGYIPYPFFFVILWFSKYYWLNILIISVAVIYLIAHQGYYFYMNEKIKEIKIGF